MLYNSQTERKSPENSSAVTEEPASGSGSESSFELPDPDLFPTFWINHASRAIMGRFEERLRPLGYGTAYLPVLYSLEAGPKQQKELLAKFSISQPTLAALLQRMERDGVVTRETNPHDRRAQFVALTPRVRADLPRVFQVLQEAVAEALVGISQDDRDRLMAVLKVVVRNLDASGAKEASER